jgi:hypothetical protein
MNRKKHLSFWRIETASKAIRKKVRANHLQTPELHSMLTKSKANGSLTSGQQTTAARFTGLECCGPGESSQGN